MSPTGPSRLGSSIAVLPAPVQPDPVKGTFLLCSKVTFSYCCDILADFSGFGIAANEVSAWAALKRFDMAAGIARAAPLKEDKLHLLAIVASAMARTSQPVPEELQ